MSKILKKIYDQKRYEDNKEIILAKNKIKRNSVRINIPCKQCGKDRWVVKYQYDYESKLARYTGLCKKCAGQSRAREFSPMWKGGKIKINGYILIKLPLGDFFASMSNSTGYVLEHRLVIAKHLNRCLLSWEVVHHKNGVRDDNRLGNLELLPQSKFHLVDLHTKSYIKSLEARIENLEEEICILRKNVK